MGAHAEASALGMSDLEQAVKTKNVPMVCHIANEGNFGIGDVPRLQMVSAKLESMKTPQTEERHITEINTAAVRIGAVIEFLKTGKS